VNEKMMKTVALASWSVVRRSRRLRIELSSIAPPLWVSAPVPEVKVERRDRPVIERREVETTGRGGCDSKTVRREDPEGSTTVKKKRCN
jgi:hypothetical protein